MEKITPNEIKILIEIIQNKGDNIVDLDIDDLIQLCNNEIKRIMKENDMLYECINTFEYELFEINVKQIDKLIILTRKLNIKKMMRKSK